MRTCEVCGTSIEHRRRQARYCGKRCSKRAQRMGLAKSQPLPVTKIVPASPPKRLRKPSRDDIAHAILDAKAVESSLRFASERADFRYRPMCRRIADAIGSALESEGLR